VAGVAKKTKHLLDTLSRRGPHGVDTGDLGFTRIPGTVHVPRDAPSPAPTIAFAHDWTKSPRHYVDTAKHLASWGFVVVMPKVATRLVPDQQKFADQLSAAIENTFYATLGRGAVRANTRRLGLVGHGMGGGVAVLLASQRTDVDAVVPVFPKETVPAASDRAVLCSCPAMILSASGGALARDAMDIHRAWLGPVVHRRLENGIETGFVERKPLLSGIGLADPDARTLRTVRPLLAGYLLATVAGDDTYSAFADPDEKIKDSVVVTDEMLQKDEDDVLAGAPPLLRLVKTVTGG